MTGFGRDVFAIPRSLDRIGFTSKLSEKMIVVN